MPTYVYRRADGTTFELNQRISADPLTEDPETGQPVTRVISGGAGLQFKGTGFYLTDYVHPGSSERKADAKGGDGSPKTPASKDSSASSDAKPAASTPATPAPASAPAPSASKD